MGFFLEAIMDDLPDEFQNKLLKVVMELAQNKIILEKKLNFKQLQDLFGEKFEEIKSIEIFSLINVIVAIGLKKK